MSDIDKKKWIKFELRFNSIKIDKDWIKLQFLIDVFY